MDQRETLARLSGLKGWLMAVRSNHRQEGPQKPGSPRTPGGWRSWVRIPARSRKLWLDPPSGSFWSSSHHEKRKRSSNRLFLVKCPGGKANTKTVSQKLVIICTFQLFILHTLPPSMIPIRSAVLHTAKDTFSQNRLCRSHFLGPFQYRNSICQ